MSVIKIARKIVNLLKNAKSLRQNGFHHAADKYEESARRLKEKHNIKQELLEEEIPRPKNLEELVFNVGSKLFRRKRIAWQEAIFESCCKFYHCDGFTFPRSNLKVVSGEKEVRKQFIETYLHFHIEGEKQADIYLTALKVERAHPFPTYETLNEEFDPQTEKRSFLLGFCGGVSQRLNELKRMKEEIEFSETAIENELKKNKPQTKNLLTGKETSPNLPVATEHRSVTNQTKTNNCTALIKSDRIIIPEENRCYDSGPRRPPPPKFTKISPNASLAGQQAALNLKLNKELEELITELNKKVTQLRNKQAEINQHKQASSLIDFILGTGNV